MALAFALISYYTFKVYTIDDCVNYAYGLNSLIANDLDIGLIDDYIAQGHDYPGYDDIEAHLYKLREAYPDIEFLYVYQIQEDGCHVIFDLDTEDVPASEPGEVVDLDTAFRNNIPDLLAGKEIKPAITNDSYSYLLTIYTPLYDSRGVCKCYVGVNYSMELLLSFVRTIIRQIILLFLIVVLMIVVVSVLLTDRGIIKPMRRLEKRAYYVSLPYDPKEVSTGRTTTITLPLEALVDIESTEVARFVFSARGIDETALFNNEFTIYPGGGSPLTIVEQPVSMTVKPGESAAFSVGVKGGKKPYAYQWQVFVDGKWQDIPGATGSTLTLDKVKPEWNGRRTRCVVTDAKGTVVISQEAVLTVTGSSDSGLPDTGDHSKLPLYLIVALAAIALMLLLRRRERE